MEWLCLRLVCVFVLLIEGAVDLDLLVSALVLEEVDGGFSSMSVLLPFGLILFWARTSTTCTVTAATL